MSALVLRDGPGLGRHYRPTSSPAADRVIELPRSATAGLVRFRYSELRTQEAVLPLAAVDENMYPSTEAVRSK